MFTSLFRLLVLFSLGITSLRADVTVASIFTDHAVLQRDQPVPIWGRADAGEKITVKFLHQNVTTSADVDGHWTVNLAPLQASAQPAELIIAGKNTVRLTDILVGEVWLASGQSNMEFPVYQTGNPNFQLDHALTEVAAANHPLIREIRVNHIVADRPAESFKGTWTVCAPETVGMFSAVGYFFARDLLQQLQVPIGIIHSSWGGTPVESWMSAAALDSRPEFAVVRERWAQALADYPALKAEFNTAMAAWERDAAVARQVSPAAMNEFVKTHRRPRAPRGQGDSWTPSGLFNGMIAPVVPGAFRGAIWYQGESNADRASEYAALFGAMIAQWRRSFGREFPFYFVQLANFRPPDKTGQSYAFLREAQAQALALPQTGMAVTIDIGNPGNIHPGNKQDVGHRLALIALAKDYGRKSEFCGPVFVTASREAGSLRLKFDHAKELIARDGKLIGFTLAGADRIFHAADGLIEGATVVVSAKQVTEPVAVRYAWANAPESSLVNELGLPAAPFRSDNWSH